MQPYVDDSDFRLYQGDALEVLRGLPDESVHCCVTSPPYWGLRDYGTGEWEGGDSGCDHVASRATQNLDKLGERYAGGGHKASSEGAIVAQFRDVCGKCSARRVDKQLGLEPTPEEYVANMVALFREVRRVLRRDGTCWLNLGDSYAGGGGGNYGSGLNVSTHKANPTAGRDKPSAVGTGLKPKDLVGIPWRVAFALQADGWYLRADVVWSKPNPMPESVTDRPTKAHEYVFLLTRSARYFFDQEAVREPAEWARWGDQTNEKHEGSGSAAGWITSKSKAELQRPQARRAMELFEQAGLTEEHARAIRAVGITDTGKATVTQSGTGKSDPHLIALAQEAKEALGGYYREFLVPNGRNVRSVWEIATRPYADAHFATYPPELVRRCILAGTSEHGCCPECGAPWERVVKRETRAPATRQGNKPIRYMASAEAGAGQTNLARSNLGMVKVAETTGWRPSCDHDHAPIPAVVLDPFMGSGTTAHVARKHGRRSIGIELNPDYCELAAKRMQQLSLLTGDAA